MSALLPHSPSCLPDTPNLVSVLPAADQGVELTSCPQRGDPIDDLPAGFLAKADGIYQLRQAEGEEASVRLCSPLLVRGICRGLDGRGWGRVVEVLDPDGRWHHHVIDEALLAGRPDTVLRPLFELGLVLDPVDKAAPSVAQLLHAWRPDARFTRVHACGWTEGSHQTFVLAHDRVIGSNQMVVPTGFACDVSSSARESGTLRSWRESVGALCVENPLMMLVVGHALAGPLLRPLGMEGGGFHLLGGSSMGKTTIQKVAVSIWGGPSFLQSWRATDNGIEGLAVARNDTLLVLNELTEVCPSKVGDIVYMLANGQGKVRARQDGSIAPGANWRVPLLSSGEISVDAHMNSAGKRIHAGQEVRLIDICADNRSHGAFDCLHDMAGSAVFAEHLEKMTATHHGMAGPEFVRGLINEHHAIQLAAKLLDRFCAIALERVDVVPDGKIRRVLRRFMLTAVAGEIATKFGVTDWTRGTALRAAIEEFRRWLQDSDAATRSDISNAILATREYLDAHRHRFVAIGQTCAPGEPGWMDEQHFYFRSETLVCPHRVVRVDC